MSKVKITNTCKDKCVGFSFKMLKPGQSTVIDDERITVADMRLIKNAGLATIEDFVAEKEDKKASDNKDTKEPDAPKKEKKDEGEIISPESDKDEDSEPSIITPENSVGLEGDEDNSSEKDQVKEEVVADRDEIPPEGEPEVNAKIYTRDELMALGRQDLRKIGKPLGVSGKAIDKLVSDILKAQGNE